MITRDYVSTMASYNQWINTKLYATAGELPQVDLVSERRAFFGSIIGTLNHIVVGDTIWLKRFATHSSGFRSLDPVRALDSPVALNQILFSDLQDLSARRTMLDSCILAWSDEITEADLQQIIAYTNMRGIAARKTLAALLLQFFNHQTHHRGQATTLLSQAGKDVGVTDVLALLPDVEA